MATNNPLRSKLKARYGAGNYRIRHDGSVLIRGIGKVLWHRIGTVGKGKFREPRNKADRGEWNKTTLYLYDVDIRRAKIVGNENISLGVRRALELAAPDIT